MLDRLAALARRQPDHRVAERLNAEGLRTRTGKEWTYARVHSIREQHAIPTGCPLMPYHTTVRADGLVSSKKAAERLGVSSSLINHGSSTACSGMISARRRPRSDQLDPGSIETLTGEAPDAINLPTFQSIMAQTKTTSDQPWQHVSDGRYLAYRVRHGQTWQWRLKVVPAPRTIRGHRKGDTPYE